MNKRTILMSIALAAVFVPVLAFAQTKDLNFAASKIGALISTATKIVYGLAFLAFFWGLAMYLFKAGDDDKKKGIQIIITSIIVIFVMTSIFGIVKVLQATFGADDNTVNDIQIPGIQMR